MSSSGFFVRPKRPNNKPQQKTEKTNKPRQKKDDETQKKPFDKKLWRLKKYSKKYKLEQWEEKRRKVMLREYRKRTADEPKPDVSKYYDEDANNDNNTNLDIVEAGPSPVEEELTPKERREKQRLEREKAVKEAKKRKLDKYRKLSKRTKKSQPIMKYRMEMLLEEIQEKLKKE